MPRPALAEAPLPPSVDVAIVGSGYTGLHAALQVARGGRSTLVVDAEDAGFGCSTRNGGQVSTSVKPSFDALARRHGRDRAEAILEEGRRSLAWMGEFVAAEKIDCDFEVCGRFHAAHHAAAYERLARAIEAKPGGVAIDAHAVPRAEQRSELGTDAYFGGVVYRRHASIDPARYHQGLLERVAAAGATIAVRCPVRSIARDGDRHLIARRAGACARATS